MAPSTRATVRLVKPAAAKRIDVSGLRIALCTDGEVWGGVERFLLSLAIGLRESGCAPDIVVFHDALLARRLRENGFTPVVIGTAGRYGRSQVSDLRQLLRRRGTTVLHAHGYRGTIVGALAARGTPTRLVRTVHGLLEPPEDWHGLFAYAKLAAYRKVEQVAARATNARTVFVSADIARRSLGRDAGGHVIANGLDPADMPIPVWGRAHSGFQIGIVGRLVKVKGHQYLFDALRRLRHLPDVHLHVFGSGPLLEPCQRAVAANALEGRVTFHGFCEDVCERVRWLDVLAMPSLHEGLPYVLLEGMYLGVPVVASAVGGLRELIKDGENGLLVPPADGAALAARLERLYHDGELRRRLGVAAHALVRERYLVDRMTDEYLSVYLTPPAAPRV